MKYRLQSCLLFPVVLIALGPLAAQAQPNTFRLSDQSGAELFQRFCTSCHGEMGQGDGPVAPTLLVRVPDLTAISRRREGEFPVNEVREIIDGRTNVLAHGTRAMPVWGYELWWEEGADVVAEAEARSLIDALVDYLRSIQEGD